MTIVIVLEHGERFNLSVDHLSDLRNEVVYLTNKLADVDSSVVFSEKISRIFISGRS